MNLLAEYLVNVHTAVQACTQNMRIFAVRHVGGVIRAVTSAKTLQAVQHMNDSDRVQLLHW